MNRRDLDDILLKVPRDPEKRYRALASLIIAGDIIGPFRYYGVRSDDPNDIVPHENRRDLRGLYVFAAWLNHTDSKSLNSLDSVVEENGRALHQALPDRFRRHPGQRQLRGQESRARATSTCSTSSPPRRSSSPWGSTCPRGSAPDFPRIPAVGHLEYQVFDPRRWKINYPNPAFDSRLPDDVFWAARRVVAFTDERSARWWPPANTATRARRTGSPAP